MAEVRKKLRRAFVRGMETIGSTATGIANSARYKVDEMNMLNTRKELLGKVASEAYTLWQQGTSMPDEIAELLREISEIDRQLDVMRAEYIESVKPAQPQYTSADADETSTDKATAEAPSVEELIGNMSGIGQAIDDFTRELMESPSSVDSTAVAPHDDASPKEQESEH